LKVKHKTTQGRQEKRATRESRHHWAVWPRVIKRKEEIKKKGKRKRRMIKYVWFGFVFVLTCMDLSSFFSNRESVS